MTDDMHKLNAGYMPLGNAMQALPLFCACQHSPARSRKEY